MTMQTTESTEAAPEHIPHTTAPSAPLAQVPIDTATVLIVDPCHIPADVLQGLIRPNDYGVTVGAVLAVPGGDGWLTVYDNGDDDGTATIVGPWDGTFALPWKGAFDVKAS